jgi:beta-glucanase (GH16 family)
MNLRCVAPLVALATACSAYDPSASVSSISQAASTTTGYVGCYTDSSARALPHGLASGGATVESCVALAKSHDLAYAGLQYGGQCFGGDTLGRQLVATSECNMPCNADSKEICGGSWRNSIYTTGATLDAGVRKDGASQPDSNAGSVVPYSNGADAPGPGSTDPAGKPWHLIFDDEFDGTSLDTSKWSKGWFAQSATSITPPVNPAPACFDPANVSVSDGHLNLTMTGPGSYTDESGKTYRYATGQVTTAPSDGLGGVYFDYLHGYMEARCYLPGSGSIDNWPAFWATGVVTGTPDTWPATGEIDVMEGLGGGVYGHWHGPTPGAPNTESSFGVTPSSPDSFTGWHVYGATWTTSVITWYYDGVKIGSGTPAEVTETPMYLLLNNQARSSGPVTPGTMMVDYVRVWQ